MPFGLTLRNDGKIHRESRLDEKLLGTTLGFGPRHPGVAARQALKRRLDAVSGRARLGSGVR